MPQKTGAGGEPQNFDKDNGRYTKGGAGYDSRSDINNLRVKRRITLTKQEYSVLRKEVMRKNSEQNGKVKPTDFAYTSNKFYVYFTSGGDSFVPLIQLDIEEDREEINKHLEWFRE